MSELGKGAAYGGEDLRSGMGKDLRYEKRNQESLANGCCMCCEVRLTWV